MRLLIPVLIALALADAAVFSEDAHATTRYHNGVIVFSRGRVSQTTGRSDFSIYTIHANGSHLRRLTHASDDGTPRFSPDGRKIVFARFSSGAEQIFVMNADGSHVRRLTHSSSSAGNQTPSFSPNGKKIVFVRSYSSPSASYVDIFVMSSNGSHVRRLTHGGSSSVFPGLPSFSPDGKKIVFTRFTSKYTDIFVVDSNGSRMRRLTHSSFPGSNFAGGFSPDGKKIVFARFGSNFGDVFVMSSNGSHVRRLTHSKFPVSNGGGGESGVPRFSPDGRKIVFLRSTANRAEIVTMNANGSRARQVANTPANKPNEYPDWQPLSVRR